ncbi:hypothetical protein HanPSC8_Chr06g0257661 [Helianthus annuus]|nr:hypothetical protein HanIR_Chr06g0287271 [Helianthus annuus]KAJ0916100.1 hypothetical protein HanPSC8_Chr06g0257661 [Helianthus annuus]
MGTKRMEEIEVVMKRFGDEQSTLMDRFERLSFEVQLNQAILSRSLSEPVAPRHQPRLPPASESKARGRQRHHRGLRFQKVMKKLFNPIFGSRKEGRKESIPHFKFIKAFSRSMRV